jgi:hypothetical protein
MLISRYNAKDTSVVVNDVYITGLGEDMISVEKEEDLASNKVGAQGDIVRSEINNTIYTITVTVQSTSPQLGYLLNLKDSTDFFPLWVINKSLGVRAGGAKAMVSSIPEIALGAEAEDIEVAFTVYDGDIIAS